MCFVVLQVQQHDSSPMPGHAERPPQAPGLVSKAENPLSGKASAVAAASKGDNCTLVKPMPLNGCMQNCFQAARNTCLYDSRQQLPTGLQLRQHLQLR